MATRQEIRLRAAKRAFAEAYRHLHAYVDESLADRRYDPEGMDVARLADSAKRATETIDYVSERKASR